MKKFLKILLVFVLLVAGVVLGVGFTQNTTAENRTEVIIAAPLDKVRAVVEDPKRTPEWLPKDVADIEKVEALPKAKDAADKNAATHRYFIKGGKTMDMQTTVSDEKKYMERVIGGDTGMEKFFVSMEWGFELAPVENDKGKTRLTCVSKGVSKRPLGTFVQSVMKWSGKPAKDAKRMAENIEKVANATK